MACHHFNKGHNYLASGVRVSCRGVTELGNEEVPLPMRCSEIVGVQDLGLAGERQSTTEAVAVNSVLLDFVADNAFGRI